MIVVALGGNALLRRGERLDADVQRANVSRAARVIGSLARRHPLVVTHGNGPQVGLLALQNAAYTETAPYPLDVLGAESEGMIGYVLEQELGRHLPARELATLITQVVVDPSDPAFSSPTKPVGPIYTQAEACKLASARGWSFSTDTAGWRRVVPSPDPKAVVEIETIRILVGHGVTVTCAGGGGVPVVPDPLGGYNGVEAVVDKDLSAALLAIELEADALLLLTDVTNVYEGFGTPDQRRIDRADPVTLRGLRFPAGSMGPKVEAACRFVEAGGRLAGIGAMGDAEAILAARAGTVVVTDAGWEARRRLRR